MVELTERELMTRLEEPGRIGVFVYTPMCGTCKAASRMLEVIEAMHPQAKLAKININFMPQLTAAWKIESVPCFLQLNNGSPVDKLYAFGSVQDLNVRLFPLFQGVTSE